jgi:hypothetical protein
VICSNFYELFPFDRNLGKLLRANRTCRNIAAQLSPPIKKSPLSEVDMEEDASAPSSRTRWNLANELNVLALIKGTEHYIYVYDDDSRPQLIDTFRDQAADPQLSLSWFDAIVLTTKARE